MENTITFDLNKMGSLDKKSMFKVIEAYGFLTSYLSPQEMPDIFATGFNINTGYVYIALENDIQICSCFGRSVECLVTDFDTGEEYFFDDYDEAEKKLDELRTKQLAS
tara:strand:+ start:4784 stop:5107 length:324 start_codon:yes stop_codon:yes gene_type:complete